MDQIRQIPTLTDLWLHEVELMRRDRHGLYLCQYIGDVDLFVEKYRVPREYSYSNVNVTPIQRGTLQIFEILNIFYDNYLYFLDNLNQVMTLGVYYEKTPSETKFNKFDKGLNLIQVNLFQLMENVRLFYLGDIGQEIINSSPVDVIKKYFGSSEFFFNMFPNHDYFNKRKSLEYAANLGVIPRYTESALTRIPLLGTHHPPMKSTFQKYWDAWNEVASTDSDSQRQWDAASNGLHRGMSAAFGALSLVPRVYNQKKKTDSEQKQIEMVAVPASERSKSLTKGALSTQLMQRLSQHPSVSQRDKTKTFETLHNRVHSQPKPSGGSKKSKTRKNRKTRY